jgi:sugar (pentulose or hexulose) kinase
MAATNSVAPRTGNVSAGTSIFGMIVLEKEPAKVYTEIDLVTTPHGCLVGMAHCNNCTSDINDWVALFGEFAALVGADVARSQIFDLLFNKALAGDRDSGGLLAYNYISGEHNTGCAEGRPLFVRGSEGNFNLANFMRAHLFSALATLQLGLDVLLKEEGAKVERLYGHGGFFKTAGVGQACLAAALNAPVAVLATAGEGGAWGIALLAAYLRMREAGETLDDFLQHKVFGDGTGALMPPDPELVQSFAIFMERYKSGLEVERAAVKYIKQ